MRMIEMSKHIHCPCHNCPDRWINPDTLETCRPSCQRGYGEWLEQENNRRKKIEQGREVENSMHDHYKALAKRLRREKGR